MNKNLSLKIKVIILFIEYFIFSGITIFLHNIFTTVLEIDRFYSLLFVIFIYLIYYFLAEFYFNCTLCMRMFGVYITNKKEKKINSSFLIYTLLVFFDRTILIVFYMLGVILNYEGLLLSEKYSDLKWVRK